MGPNALYAQLVSAPTEQSLFSADTSLCTMYALSRTTCEQIDGEARCAAERAKVRTAEKYLIYLLDLHEFAFIMRSNGMLFVNIFVRGPFVNAFENFTYQEVVQQGLYDFG